MTLAGIDISYAQTTTPNLTGLSFAFARATYSLANDSRYAQHAADIKSAGLVLGAYHFWYDGQSGAAQASHFLSVAGSAELLALDFEGAAADIAGAKAFIAAVQKAGRKIGLYHSLSGYPSWGQDFRWVAYWNASPPPIAWDFWQYGGSGIDEDQFAGDKAALAALAGRTTGGIDIPGGNDVQFVNGYGRAPGDTVHAPAGTQVYQLDGTALYNLPVALDLPVIGHADVTSSDYIVEITTGTVYGDKVPRPTWLLVKLPGVTPVAHPVQGDITHQVGLTVDGVAKATITV